VVWILIPVLVLLGFGVDRVLLWMEWEGWIDYRRTNPGRIQSGPVGPAFLAVQSLFQSGAKHHLDEKNAVRTERNASGDGDE